jgi:hypothetical protein
MKRKTPPAPAPVETAPAPARRRAFLAITLLAPLLLLLGAEAALRLAGIGALEPLLIPVPKAEGFLQPNPAAVQRFFPDPRRAPEVSIDTTWFPAEKAPGTLRIFVQGESSAAGFPYGRWASPAALLQQRLQRAYPEREVEVINTGMAAVTSYVLLDFAEEIIAQRPDAVVIYTGHNEFLGIGGVGSSLASASSPALARTIATLRRLHLYRALERGLGSLGSGADPLATREVTLMSRVAAERSIPLGSTLYERGVEQFRGNLDRLLAIYQAAGIPVFIGTLASNERDQAPFASGDDPADSARARFERGRALEAAGDYAAARDRVSRRQGPRRAAIPRAGGFQPGHPRRGRGARRDGGGRAGRRSPPPRRTASSGRGSCSSTCTRTSRATSGSRARTSRRMVRWLGPPARRGGRSHREPRDPRDGRRPAAR